MTLHTVHSPTHPLFPEGEYALALASALAEVCTRERLQVLHAHYGIPFAASAYLARALLGRVPSVSELDTFIKNKAENKREQLVNSLLGDSNYADESSKRLAALWTNVLIGRVGGQTPDRIASRAGLVDYLTRAFRENRSFDKIVKELLTATGSSDPAASDYNGAVNFLLDGYSNKATLATARPVPIG